MGDYQVFIVLISKVCFFLSLSISLSLSLSLFVSLFLSDTHTPILVVSIFKCTCQLSCGLSICLPACCRCNRLATLSQQRTGGVCCRRRHVYTLQHTTTHRNTLQHTATHCNTLQHTATHCNTLQHTATDLQHCNTLQHTATHCNTRNTRQHTATPCNTLQHPATHCQLPVYLSVCLPACILAFLSACLSVFSSLHLLVGQKFVMHFKNMLHVDRSLLTYIQVSFMGLFSHI